MRCWGRALGESSTRPITFDAAPDEAVRAVHDMTPVLPPSDTTALLARAVEGGAETVTIIRPQSGWAPLDLQELWAYRELLYFLVWRDIKVRYKQTALGA